MQSSIKTCASSSSINYKVFTSNTLLLSAEATVQKIIHAWPLPKELPGNALSEADANASQDRTFMFDKMTKMTMSVKWVGFWRL